MDTVIIVMILATIGVVWYYVIYKPAHAYDTDSSLPPALSGLASEVRHMFSNLEAHNNSIH
jgi:hypothetical protein